MTGPEDVVDGWAAAAQLPDDLFADMVLTALTDRADEWDRPARLYAVVMGGTDEAVEHVVRKANPAARVEGRGRGRVSIDGRIGITFGVALVDEIAGHPYDHMVGLDAPDEVAAQILVSEAWATVFADDDGPLLEGYTEDVVVDGSGRAEIRMATAVDRFGRTAHGHLVRGGGTSVQIESADTTRLPVGGTGPADDRDGGRAGRLVMGGRIIDGLRRSIGLSGRPLTTRPWLRVAGRWCELAVHNLPAAERTGDVDGLCAALMTMRPDVVATMYAMVSEQARARVADAGLDMDDPRAESIIAQTPRPELPGNPALLVERCDRMVADTQPMRPDIGWLTAATPIRLDPEAYGTDPAEAAWLDDQSLVNAIGGLTDADDESSIDRFAATARRWPAWFIDSALGFTGRAKDLVCDPAPVPDPPVG